MGSLGTFDISIKKLFENIDTVEDFTKSELKLMLCWATDESYVISNGLLYKQTDGVTKSSPSDLPLITHFCHPMQKLKQLSQLFFSSVVSTMF